MSSSTVVSADRRRIRMGLKVKSVLGLGAFLLVGYIFLGVAIYQQGRTVAIQGILESTRQKISSDTVLIESLLKHSTGDLLFLAYTPPIQGIIRARDNHGLDPLNGHRGELWGNHLEQVFAAFLNSHPEYDQISYLDGQGNELVRADLLGTTARFASRRELRNQAGRQYFSEALQLKANEVYYSEVALNREDGVIQVPHTPVFRLATPVYDTKQRIRGVVVLKLLADNLFAPVRSDLLGGSKYVVNQDGFLLAHPDRSKEFGFDLGFDFRLTDLMPKLAGELQKELLNDGLVDYHQEEGHVHGFKKVYFNPKDRSRFWAVIHVIPEAQALGQINQVKKMTLAVGLAITACSLLLITWLTSKYLIAPILKVSAAVTRMKNGDLTVRIQESGRSDELGELAVSLNRMAMATEKRIEALTAINVVARSASGLLSAAEIADNFINALLDMQLRNVEKKAVIFLADAETNSLKLLASKGVSEAQQAQDVSVPFGDCFCGAVAETGQPIFSANCCDDPRHTRGNIQASPHGHVILPLKVGTLLIGVMALYLKVDTECTDEDRQLYLSIADILAVSLQNALRFAHIEKLKSHHTSILNCAGEGIYGVDLQGNGTFFNTAAEKMLGWEASELLGRHVHDISHYRKADGSDYPAEECPIYRASVDGTMRQVDDELFWRKDGSAFPVEYTSTPTFADCKIVGAVVVFRDITERKRSEEALLRYHEEVLSLAQSSNVVLAITESPFETVCNIAVRNFGLRMAWIGLIDEGSYEVKPVAHAGIEEGYLQSVKITHDDSPTSSGPTGRAIKTNSTQVINDLQSDPRFAIWAEEASKRGYNSIASFPLHSTSDDRIIGALTLYSDSPGFFSPERLKLLQIFANQTTSAIENRRLIDGLEAKVLERTKALHLANEDLKKTFNAIEQSSESIVITDINGKIQYVNPAFVERTGYSSAEAVGKNPRILKSGRTPPQVYREMWQTLTSGKKWRGILINRKKSGEHYHEDATISPVLDNDGKITNYIAVKIDITERIHSEYELTRKNSELEAARLQAESANQAKSEFLANMSHEIRTPMNGIIGLTHLALQTALAPRQEGYLKQIATSANSLLGIINDILDFSKIEAGRLTLEQTTFCLESVLRLAVDTVVGRAREKGLEIVLLEDAAVPHHLQGDPLRLGQVLINLAGNAVKFTEHGEVVIKTELIAVDAETAAIRFALIDSGIGMNAEQVGRLFEPFSQADSSTTRNFGGTGLGLSISKRLVEMMGGEITVESQPGQGTCFSFTLLFGTTDQEEIPPLQPPLELREMRVLLVDDNPTALSGLTQILQSLTFRVEPAYSGLEALALLEQADRAGAPFRLVILDYQMPQLDGLETARRINECNPPLSVVPRVILLSRDDWDERVNRPEEFGVSGYLLKPVTSSELFDAIMVAFSAPIRGGSELCRKSRKAYSFWGTAANLTGIRALLVEDNEINQLVATELLHSWGVQVVVARNGVEAVALAKNGDFDVILMDIQMPKMDGFAATREIRRLPSKRGQVPIIAMTALAMTGDREKSLAAGMNDHVTKPIDPKLLHAALRRWSEAASGDPRPARESRIGEDGGEADFPAELTGVNWADGLKRVAGNRRLYQQLLRMFTRDFTPFTTQVQAALAEDDSETAQRLAHTLKGLAGQLGMPGVQAAAAELEAGIHGQPEEIPTLLRKTTAELAPILATLSKTFPTEQTTPAAAPVQVDMPRLDQQLKEFARLLEVNDMRAISDFEELQGALDQLRPEESSRLSAHLETLNFKGARQVLLEIGEALGISLLH